MATPHNRAEKGQIAKTVLMPGDPLRAKHIAEQFLKDPVLFNDVRGMYGCTGFYQGRPVSVMASGMGMPSMGIYSHELYSEYEVENIIRIGSAGAYTDQLRLYDVLLVTGSYSESSYAKTMSGCTKEILQPTEKLCQDLREGAKRLGIPLAEGLVHSSDVFYSHDDRKDPAYWELLRDEKGCMAVEMESFALFANAQVLKKQAACLLTISDHFVHHQRASAEERQTSFNRMVQIALETAAAL